MVLIRVVRDTQLFRSERQSNAFQCQIEGENDECLPSGVANVSTDLVSCVAGKYMCMGGGGA